MVIPGYQVHTGAAALSLKNKEVDRLARRLAEATSQSITQAILQSLREQLAGQQQKAKRRGRPAAVGNGSGIVPVLDQRWADQILGYDERGLQA